jgi:transposase
MSQKKSNSYTAEFKEAAVKLAVESDQPYAPINQHLFSSH